MIGAFERLVSFGYGAGRGLRNLFAVVVITAGMASADERIVVAMGDSLTQGYGLPAEDGLVPQLDRWLDAQGVTVELRNAGVSGDTTTGGLARVDWTLTPDVDAMIVALGANDYLRGLDPALARANMMGILEAAQAKEVPVFLVGLNVGNNYGPAYKEAFDAMYTDLSDIYDAPLYPAFFKGMRDATDDGVLLPYMQADGLHPTAEGVALIVQDLGPFVQTFIANLKE